MIGQILYLVCIAVLYGYIEQHVYRHGYRDNGPHILKINPRYHLPMVAMWTVICWSAGAWWFIGIFAVIEDWSYFRFHPSDSLDPKDWVTFGLGGIGWPGKLYIPTTYFIGVGISALLYWIGGR